MTTTSDTELLSHRDSFAAELTWLYDAGWRLVTTGGDTVDTLVLLHVETGAQLPVWRARDGA